MKERCNAVRTKATHERWIRAKGGIGVLLKVNRKGWFKNEKIKALCECVIVDSKREKGIWPIEE